MENKKQSSIEWLFFELLYTPKDKFEWHSILRKAKKMHREEIQNSFVEGTQFICEDELGARFESTMYYVMNYENEN